MSVPTLDEMRTRLHEAVLRNVGHGKRFTNMVHAVPIGRVH